MPAIQPTVEPPNYTITISLTQTEFAPQKTSIPPTITPLPHTRPTLCVSLRNCCHRGNITTRTKQPNSAKTVQLSQCAQTAPLSQLSQFTPLSVTSKPRTQRASYAETYQTAEYRSLCTFSLAFSDPLPA